MSPLLAVLFTRDGSVSLQELIGGLGGCQALGVVVDADPQWRADLVDHLKAMLPAAAALSPDADAGTVDAAVEAALGGRGLSGAVTFSESVVPLTDGLATRWGRPHNGAAATAALTDKWVQRTALAAGGVTVPRVRRLDTGAEWPALRKDLPGACVVKPVRGFGSAHTVALADGEDELPATVADELGAGRPFVVEELLVGMPHPPYGDYVSVESLVADGVVRHLGVTGKLALTPPFRETGQFFPADLPEAELRQCLAMAARAVVATGMRVGLTHTELKLTADGPRVIEVNGRLGGYIGDLIRRATGTEVVTLACDAAEGRPHPTLELLEAARVAFSWNSMPPLAAREVVAVAGVDAVRGAPGVVGYQSYVRAGTRLAGGCGTDELDVLRGECADAGEVIGLLQAALAPLRLSLRDAEGEVVERSGLQLPGAAALQD